MASLRSKFEEHLTCSVCLEALKEPKVFPCLHSFCLKCVENLITKAKSTCINCPECRKPVQVDNPSNLPSNFFVNNLLATMALTDEKKEKKIQCDSCMDGNVAATRCGECAMFLCSYCSEFHKKSRITNKHVLTTLEELKCGASPLSVAEKVLCEKHKGELIKLYCNTCQSTICRDCTIVEHRTHDYGFIEDVAAQQKQILKRNLSEVQQRQATLQRGIASLKQFDQSLVDENALVTAQVSSHFDELQKLLLSKKNELTTKANSMSNMKRKQLHAQIEALEMASASCTSSVEFTEKAFKNGNDTQVLSMQKYILKSLQDLKNVKDDTKPCVTRDMIFSFPWSIEDSKKNYLSYFAVGDVVADPDQCQAEFTDQSEHLKRGEPNSVNIFCFDKNKKRVEKGGQVVQVDIAGTEVVDVTTQDNRDGSHTVTFTPRHGGTLTFEATIDGRPAPRCSLTKDVSWIFGNDYGNGELCDGNLKLSCNNLGQCWRIGECSFESGVHTWKILVKPGNQNILHGGPRYLRGGFYGENGEYSCCDIGVTALADSRSPVYHPVQSLEEVCVTVTLDIPNMSLRIATEGNDLGMQVREMGISNSVKRIKKSAVKSNKFWPFVRCYLNTVAILKYD